MYPQRNLMTSPGLGRLFPLALLLPLSLGCGSAPPAITENESQHLRQIGTAYSAASAKLGRPPATEQELLPHLQELGDPQQILRSPRDGQPYVIVWKVRMSDTRMPPPIIAYEKDGVNGTRWVLTTMGIRPMDQADFEKEAPRQ